MHPFTCTGVQKKVNNKLAWGQIRKEITLVVCTYVFLHLYMLITALLLADFQNLLLIQTFSTLKVGLLCSLHVAGHPGFIAYDSATGSPCIIFLILKPCLDRIQSHVLTITPAPLTNNPMALEAFAKKEHFLDIFSLDMS